MKLTNLFKLLPVTLVLTSFIAAQHAEAQSPARNTRRATIAAKTPQTGVEHLYDRYMRLGYAASVKKDYKTATNYFKMALQRRPNDKYATIAYWNMVDYTRPDEARRSTQAKTAYDLFMTQGYTAAKQGDYNTALINFKKAMNKRPGDAYAAQAIRNVQTFVNSRRGVM